MTVACGECESRAENPAAAVRAGWVRFDVTGLGCPPGWHCRECRHVLLMFEDIYVFTAAPRQGVLPGV